MWILIRKPLLQAFVLGCAVSMLASRRLTPRLVVDGLISFAFVPVFVVAAFAVVYLRARPALPFTAAVDRFFDGNVPWLMWLTAITAVAAMTWSMQWPLWMLEASLLPPVAWAAYADYRFFRDVCHRPRRAALGDLALHRAVAWPLVVGYFLGAPIWTEIVPALPRLIGR